MRIISERREGRDVDKHKKLHYMSLSQIVILISLFSFLIVGLVVKRSSMASYSEFTMMRGKLSWFTIACGISMTYAGGAAILTTASIGYSFKWYSFDNRSFHCGVSFQSLSR